MLCCRRMQNALVDAHNCCKSTTCNVFLCFTSSAQSDMQFTPCQLCCTSSKCSDSQSILLLTLFSLPELSGKAESVDLAP